MFLMHLARRLQHVRGLTFTEGQYISVVDDNGITLPWRLVFEN